jgi:hypothetical protein
MLGPDRLPASVFAVGRSPWEVAHRDTAAGPVVSDTTYRWLSGWLAIKSFKYLFIYFILFLY